MQAVAWVPSLAAAARSFARARGGRQGSARHPPSCSARGLWGDGSTPGTLRTRAPLSSAPPPQAWDAQGSHDSSAHTESFCSARREPSRADRALASCNAKYFLIPSSFAVTLYRSLNQVLGNHKTGPDPAVSVSASGQREGRVRSA